MKLLLIFAVAVTTAVTAEPICLRAQHAAVIQEDMAAAVKTEGQKTAVERYKDMLELYNKYGDYMVTSIKLFWKKSMSITSIPFTEAQLAEAPKCDEDALLAALAKAERDRDAAKDRCAKEEALAASEAKRLSSERRHVTTALEAATTACQEAEATAVAARRERDAARADAEVVRRHASDMAAARKDATAQSAANDAAATVVRAYAARLEAELVDAAAEVERLTGALLANDAMTDATASM